MKLKLLQYFDQSSVLKPCLKDSIQQFVTIVAFKIPTSAAIITKSDKTDMIIVFERMNPDTILQRLLQSNTLFSRISFGYQDRGWVEGSSCGEQGQRK